MAKFKARARTLDMLGRQQIANIPTAISELFKNAHDAYANRVEVDLYRYSDLLVLTDNGIGMSKEDFEQRWLTIATESKALDQSIPKPPGGMSVRPVLGEKGIGRLSISALGRQTLILTRELKLNSKTDLVCALIHWGLFECPGIDLDEIEIPIRLIKAPGFISKQDVREMSLEIKTNVTRLSSRLNGNIRSQILNELETFVPDPAQINKTLKGPNLLNGAHGTQFIVHPVSELLYADIDGTSFSARSTKLVETLPILQKYVIGFSDTMTPGHSRPVIAASFKDYKTKESYEEYADEVKFWRKQEFDRADHRITGSFDKYGNFKGNVTIFGKTTEDYLVESPIKQGTLSECGPFELAFAYVMGKPSETKVPPAQFTEFDRKLVKLGGIYIYKDGIRILPYGDTDYDWLEIEQRRSKGLGYYFFSYRRLFGTIRISQDKNPDLVEKAGREGFRANKAFRQFRQILINFFIQLARDFFREGGEEAEEFVQEKSKARAKQLAQRHRTDVLKEERDNFKNDLEKRFAWIADEKPAEEASKITASVQSQIEKELQQHDPEKVKAKLPEIEELAEKKLDGLLAKYDIEKPRGISLTQEMRRDWSAYLNELAGIESKIIEPVRRQISKIIAAAVRSSQLDLTPPQRMKKWLTARIQTQQEAFKRDVDETMSCIDELETKMLSLIEETEQAFGQEIERIVDDKSNIVGRNTSDDELAAIQRRIDRKFVSAQGKSKEILGSLKAQIDAMQTKTIEGLLPSALDAAEAMDEAIEYFQEKTDMELELVQLGMAIETISHEFESSIKSVRSNLRRLKAWSNKNEDLSALYDVLSLSFEHLDGYLTLFTPLHRRIYRKPIVIKGSAIFEFLENLFRERLEKDEIHLEATETFLSASVRAYPSTFYPVFINLVDNAIFWLGGRRGKKLILLDADRTCFIVSDNGPGVSADDREAIFRRGYSRKPGGRGMGLYISRDVLKRAGYELFVDASTPRSAVFRVSRTKSDEASRDDEEQDEE